MSHAENTGVAKLGLRLELRFQNRGAKELLWEQEPSSAVSFQSYTSRSLLGGTEK